MPLTSPLNSLKDLLIHVKQASTGHPFLRKTFEKIHGYPLNLQNPRTFCEWVNHKKITDRDPLLTQTADKVLVRDYVRKKLGDTLAAEILIPQFWSGSKVEEIPFDTLPKEYFLKANHRSGANILVQEGMDLASIQSRCRKWTQTSFGQEWREWAYKNIPRQILCEQVIRDAEGHLPIDYKFYCIHGQVEMIGIFYKKDGISYAFYQDPYFHPVGGPLGTDTLLEEAPRIPNYLRLIQVAEQLSEDFPLVRIDLYSVENQIYFGEITHYPGSGMDRFLDPELDRALGEKLLAGKQVLSS